MSDAKFPHLEDGTDSLAKANMGQQPSRKQGELEDNPVGLSKDAARELVDDLDRHLASYSLMYHQYHKHHWLVIGPQFRDLHLFLEEHYQQVHQDLDAIAERMTVLGGIPTCSPSNQEKLAYIQHEPEGYFRTRTMLELDLECEKAISVNLRKSIKKALQHEDFATKSFLESLLLRAEDRAHHLAHYLESDTLEVGLTAEESDLKEDPALEAVGAGEV